MKKKEFLFDLMDGLLAGKTSRNHDFDLFGVPLARRAHQSLNRLLALSREMALGGSSVDFSKEGEMLSVKVSVKRLGYTRKALLRDWESEYLFERLGQKRRISP